MCRGYLPPASARYCPALGTSSSRTRPTGRGPSGEDAWLTTIDPNGSDSGTVTRVVSVGFHPAWGSVAGRFPLSTTNFQSQRAFWWEYGRRAALQERYVRLRLRRGDPWAVRGDSFLLTSSPDSHPCEAEAKKDETRGFRPGLRGRPPRDPLPGFEFVSALPGRPSCGHDVPGPGWLPSGSYAWRKRAMAARTSADIELAANIVGTP